MPSRHRSASRWNDPAVLVGLLVALIGLTVAPGAIDNIDTRICFHSAQSLIHHGTFALVDPTAIELRGLWTAQGVDGEWYSKFGIGVTLLLLPFTAFGTIGSALLPYETALVEELVASLASPFFLGVGAWAAARIAIDELRVGPTAAIVGVLAWTLGTFQLSYSGSSYLETPLAVAAVLAVREALRARRSAGWRAPALCGVYAGLVVAIKVAMVVYVPFLLLPMVCGDPRRLVRRAVGVAIPLAAWMLALMAVNHTRFGSPLSTGYVGFSTLFETPLAVGLRGYLLDPDLALPLFAPAFVVALLGLRGVHRRAPALLWAALGVFVTGTVVHALHTGYHGGTVYGPRYLISAIPLVTACGVATLWSSTSGTPRRVLAAALALAVASQIPSTLVSPNEYHTIGDRARARDESLLARAPRVHYWLRPRLVIDAILLSKKMRGDTDAYDLRELIADPSRWPPEPTFVVPDRDRGFSIWWLIAARTHTRWALLPGILLALSTLATAIALRQAARSGSPASPVETDAGPSPHARIE